MKYQAYTYSVIRDKKGSYAIIDTQKAACIETEYKIDFYEMLEKLGFNPDLVSMDSDFANDTCIELILDDGQPVGYIHEIS